MQSKCTLCNKEAELQLSHIIPIFVFNWLKETSPSAIRRSGAPNLRVQDGIKYKLLCADCEELFSSWEKEFCESIFSPLHNDSPLRAPITYSAWALKFAVSVSWRVLKYMLQTSDLSCFNEKKMDNIQVALSVWQKFLLGELPNPEQYEQHLLPMDTIDGYTGLTLSPFFHRYLLRSVDMDIIYSNSIVVVYSKLGHILLFGFIQENNARRWKGTKLHVNKGSIMNRDCRVPNYILSYLNDKADKSRKAQATISPKQSKKIQKVFNEKAVEIAESEVFRAMQYDVYHSGKRAFKQAESDKDNETQG